ncbi:PP2C family protein-serine/threonine phosphatase [Clostridium sp. C2-6-12]|uniref:PP2C family protein-serine/threonine phosphatase n=1 Tax=Clostridium sp. C2-6-12 TaxID=2698832 RepID=UPI00136848D2|nr:PP2C family protein-serine/threonine phosphatase [Clostridium sp. C2-6-12]
MYEKDEALTIETGYASINKHSETLCGDWFKVFENPDKKIIVLSDGLGSGVKANILSTLTSTILGTMLSKNMPLDDCIETVATALPMCKERRLAYATFSVLELTNGQAYLVQYDNPSAIILRNGKRLSYNYNVHFVKEKEIHESRILLQKEDIIILMTDGVTNAGIGKLAPNGWRNSEIEEFLERLDTKQMSPAHIAAQIVNCSLTLSEESLDDDATVFVVKVRDREVVNMLIGPPENKEDDNKVLNLFFSKSGKKVICGGSTAKVVSNYLKKPIRVMQGSGNEEIPDMSSIEGLDYVTEGIITIKKVVELIENYIKNPMSCIKLCKSKDPASLLALLLIEEATDVNIYFGMSENAAHEGTDIDFDAKLALTKQLEEGLNKMGKNVKISFC